MSQKQYIEQKLIEIVKEMDNFNVPYLMIDDYMIYHTQNDNCYYYCFVDQDKLFNNNILIDETQDFIKILNKSNKSDPIDALKDMFNFTIKDTTNSYNKFPLYDKLTNEVNLYLFYKNNNIVSKPWRYLGDTFEWIKD